MGHGSILFFVAAFLCLFARTIRSPQTKGLLEARYLLLMMGMQSAFAGLIYNEFFAIPTNIFGSCYKFNEPLLKSTGEPLPAASAGKMSTVIWRKQESRCVYPFG